MLVQKCGYIKASGAGGYMRYIATREGVEFRPGLGLATEKQKQLITQVLRDFPDSKELLEYQDYQAAPSAANASAFLSMALDSNAHAITDNSGYMRYISLRPGAERRGAHGLFGAEEFVNLDAAIQELGQCEGPVWTVIWSLRREDAARLGYEGSDAWRGLILSQQAVIAEAMRIPVEDLRWYAAYHDAGHHPHVHVMVWSAGQSRGYLDQDGIKQMRSKLTNLIYKDELMSLYQEKDISYKTLVREARQTMGRLTREMTAGICTDPIISEKLSALSKALEPIKGKKQYGYLPKQLKGMVDEFVDALAELPDVAACYDTWNSLRDQLESYYKDTPRQHLPLSRQAEFKAIKNAVIREADNLNFVVPPYMNADMAEAEDTAVHVSLPPQNHTYTREMVSQGDISQTAPKPPLPHSAYERAEKYRTAKQILLSETAPPDSQQAALDTLERLWKEGFTTAAHLIGKCYRDGIGVPVDKAEAEFWFRRSAEAGNDYSQYALGKLTLELERPQEATRWLRKAAAQGNQFAQYEMGKLCLAGEVIPKDVVEALRFFYDAATCGNQHAQFALGRLYLKGQDVQQDTGEAKYWFNRAAEQGNEYAKFFLNHMEQPHDPSVFLAVTRLLYRLEQLFQDKAAPVNTIAMSRIDSKRRRQLMDKRLAAGHSIDDHEDPRMNQTLQQ